MLSVYVLIKVHALADYSVCMRLHQAFHCIAVTTRKNNSNTPGLWISTEDKLGKVGLLNSDQMYFSSHDIDENVWSVPPSDSNSHDISWKIAEDDDKFQSL